MSYREPRVPLGVFESRCALVYYWGDPSNVVANRVLIGFRHLLKEGAARRNREGNRERNREQRAPGRSISNPTMPVPGDPYLLLYVVSSRQPWHTCMQAVVLVCARTKGCFSLP